MVITIGRQFGAGGRELGKELARILGYEYYDKELLTQAAVSAGLNPELFERADEKAPSFISGIFSFNHGMGSYSIYSGSTPISDENIYGAQADLIRHLADTRNCVIVGRTADYVLRNRPDVLSVFVHSPIEKRVERILKRQNEMGRKLTPAQAISMARKIDRLRANYYNFYTDHTWGEAATYHMSFDSSRMSIPAIAKVIATAIGS
ncbi:MAG: cytidylate kinase-like family protein [Muribaculaceae bacterium]|nr:cytidylate kinase-like family protein [Muribaculaceae bacterium]MDE6321455.1 cytidylate kinase-like family protein [Muribaculaceae bacterium]